MRKKSILIVDDETVNINILYGALESDYEIIAATSGEQAIKRAQALSPDIILLDIMMPGLDGYETCHNLKQNKKTQHIPIIFITAMSDSGYETKGLDLGAVDYITKPINAAIVKARVKHHLEREEYKNHLEEIVDSKTFELKKALAAANAANKAKSVFLMNMGHELRTPLNGIIAAAELIEDQDDIKEIINTSGYALLNMLTQILDFSRSRDGNLEWVAEPFRLDGVLAKLKCHFYYKGDKNVIKLNFDIPAGEVPNALIGYEDRLVQVLNLLLENAAKFSENKPEARLSIKAIEKNSKACILQFALKDNGIGISKKKYQAIFEPFDQVDTSCSRAYDGVGIGLALCKEFIAHMEGEIWVDSELDKGSTFYFTVKFNIQDPHSFLSVPVIPSDHFEPTSVADELNSFENKEIILSLLSELSKSLKASNPNSIKANLSALHTYNLSFLDRITNRIARYEYDDASKCIETILNTL